jgi:N-acetylglucosamine repressor
MPQPPPVPGNARLLKELNHYRILDALRRNGPMARSELARLTGLAAPTVGAIVGTLVAKGLLLEREAAPGRGLGRRAVPVAIHPGWGAAVGLNVGITHGQVLLVDLLGGVLARKSFSLPHRPGPAELVSQLSGAVRAVLGAQAARGARVLGVGTGLHGLVDHGTGVIRFAPHFGWRDLPFTDLLSQAVGLPVLADNGVRCMALGELRFGAGRGVPNFVCLAVGTGIGAAIVLDGKLYRGAGGMAGEIGHVTVDVAGPPCPCGSCGCLETLASGPAIARRAAALAPDLAAATAEAVHRAALAGDAGARLALHEAGTYLGVAVANLVKTLNPERVLIGGGVAGAGELLLGPLRRSVAARALDPASAALPVLPVALGADAGAMGAAALVLDRFFKGGAVPAALDLIDR